ncbi:MAG: bifunctional precorrin-2 dehydrogenase/sirohydrochlorin ferrochelatase [Anaerolineae bacterium]
MRYYPVYLDLRGRRCIVIGGGSVAEGKVKGLLEADARVTVVSPQLTPQLKKLLDDGHIVHVARSYQPGDLAGVFLVISATDNRSVNEQVWQEATERNITSAGLSAGLVNVVDDPTHCTFIAPSIVRRGDLAIAISTCGKAPALAVRLRQQLERTIGHEHARFLELAGGLRAPIAARYPDFEQRKALWYQLVDSDVLDLLRQRDEVAARRRIVEITGIVDIGD